MNLQLDLYENGAEPGQPACFDTGRARTDGCAHIGCAIAGSGADSDAGSDAGYCGTLDSGMRKAETWISKEMD